MKEPIIDRNTSEEVEQLTELQMSNVLEGEHLQEDDGTWEGMTVHHNTDLFERISSCIFEPDESMLIRRGRVVV